MMKLIRPVFLILFLNSYCICADAQDAEALFRQAERKYTAGDSKGAIDLYSQAIKLDPSKMKFYVRRGFCYSLLKDYDSAIDDYSKALEFDPKYKWAYISRGSARNKIAAYKEAIRDFDKALALDPKDCEAYNNRGFAKKMLGDLEGACTDWKASKKLGNEEAKIIIENNHCK